MSMKTIIQSLILVSMLSGCYQTINENDIRQAEKLCLGRENVLEISAEFNGGETVTCRNGRKYILYLSANSNG